MTKIRKEQISSGAADDGQVLTADGAGNVDWETPSAGTGDMTKAVYDTDDDGAVDKADAIDGVASAGNSKYYGTDGSGNAGFHDLPSGGAVDAGDVTYTPTTLTDWDSDADPGNVDDALDQLAERVDDLEGGASSDSLSVRATKSGNQSINNASWTTITFNTEEWDDDTMHDTSSNTERLTAKTAGTYLITGQVVFEARAGARFAKILKNSGGTEIGNHGPLEGETLDSAAVRVQVSAVTKMSVNDYVVVQGFQTSAGAAALNVTNASWFSMVKV